MARYVSQVVDDHDGTVTVVSTDKDSGRQYVSTETYNSTSSYDHERAVERATQDSLDKV